MTALTRARCASRVLDAALEDEHTARRTLHEAMRDARTEGATLGQLAHATGLSRQRVAQITGRSKDDDSAGVSARLGRHGRVRR